MYRRAAPKRRLRVAQAGRGCRLHAFVLLFSRQPSFICRGGRSRRASVSASSIAVRQLFNTHPRTWPGNADVDRDGRERRAPGPRFRGHLTCRRPVFCALLCERKPCQRSAHHRGQLPVDRLELRSQRWRAARAYSIAAPALAACILGAKSSAPSPAPPPARRGPHRVLQASVGVRTVERDTSPVSPAARPRLCHIARQMCLRRCPHAAALASHAAGQRRPPTDAAERLRPLVTLAPPPAPSPCAIAEHRPVVK